jgi:3-hydroxyacyl-CoA dehydrogenase
MEAQEQIAHVLYRRGVSHEDVQAALDAPLRPAGGPPEATAQLIDEGRLGVEAGRGFYDYSA